MKKILYLLAVATVAAAAPGCCCPRLCPCCPTNWFNRGPYCGPATTYAPLATANPCAPACTSWDPCQCAVVPQGGPGGGMLPQAPLFGQTGGCCPTGGPTYMPQAPVFAQAAPQMMAAPAYYSEPGCGYMEPNCGAPSMVGYGPMMDCGCNDCGSCGCDSGCSSCGCDGGVGAPVGPPAESFVDPTPAAE